MFSLFLHSSFEKIIEEAKMMDKSTIQLLSVSKSRDVFSYLEGIVG